MKRPEGNLLAPAPPAAGDLVEIECTDLIAKTGQAVGRADGFVVYVLGPLPGERARVRLVTVKANYAVGELVELLSRSPERVEPFCDVFGRCGGCQLQHLAYPAQLAWKRRVVESALARLGGIADPQVAQPIGAERSRAYRNKMALVIAPGPALGFYAAGTHDVVPIERCPIVAPALERVLEGLRELAGDPGHGAVLGGVRHVVARGAEASGEVVVSFTTDRPSQALAGDAAAVARQLAGVVGIANSFEPPSANAVMGRLARNLWGRPEIEEQIGALRLRVSPASFFQINREIVAALFAFLAPHLRAEVRMLDLYCGAGTFALFFAAQGARVVGFEENSYAVAEANANAARNGLDDRISILGGKVEASLRAPLGKRALEAAEIAFLDPPRKGSDEATLGALVLARVPRIWYLSCNPATLARDLAILRAGGYALEFVQPFDMFPQTGHVEALALLRCTELAPLRP
ncbi:MAG: 23S rRNA (uracil(1939)-C(5))-methyltransferase RlmD [Vulcanimicrobiaceae bacterium]